MTGMIGKLVFDRILKETRENRQGREDPYFEYVPTKKMSVFRGKPRSKRRQKALPPGLTPLEQDTLVKVKRRAYRLDMALGTCCGFQLGWGSLIGIIPGIGDVIDGLLALMVINTATDVGLPASVILHMLFNVAFDFVIGLVPLLGDLADVAYKANTRNAIVLENHLRHRGREALRRAGQPQPPDPSLADDFDVDDEAGPERGVVSQPPLAQPQPVYGASASASRGYSGARREYDPESHRGSRGGDRGGGGGGGSGGEGRSSKHKGSRHKSRERERRDHR